MGFFRLITRSPGTGASYWKSLRHSILPHCDWNGVLIFLFLFIYFLTPKTFYIGGIADSQCCASFRWTMQGLSLTYTRIHSPPKPAPTQAGTWNWAESPVLQNRFLLVIHFKHNQCVHDIPEVLNCPFPPRNHSSSSLQMEVFLLDGNKRKFQGYHLDSKENLTGDLPGCPEVRTPCFHCRRIGFDPWLGN